MADKKTILREIAYYMTFVVLVGSFFYLTVGYIKTQAENSNYCHYLVSGNEVILPIVNMTEYNCFEYCRVIDYTNPGLICNNHSSNTSLEASAAAALASSASSS